MLANNIDFFLPSTWDTGPLTRQPNGTTSKLMLPVEKKGIINYDEKKIYELKFFYNYNFFKL